MKKYLMMLVLTGMLLLSACGGMAATEEHGHDEAAGTGIEAHDAWARSALKDGNGAAYLLLHNHSTEDDALIGASSDVAGAVEIHLSQMKADGTMEMIKQESIAVPADGEVELKPGSYHVMLIGLKQDLKAGDEITVTLHFTTHEDITLTIPVMDAENMGGSGMDAHNMMEATPTP
jgi:copper(I)-binding protein